MLYREKGKIDIRRKENVIYLMLKIYGIDWYYWKIIIIEGFWNNVIEFKKKVKYNNRWVFCLFYYIGKSIVVYWFVCLNKFFVFYYYFNIVLMDRKI